MPKMPRVRRAEQGFVVTLGLLVSLGSAGRASAQAPADAGPSTWSFPEEGTGTEASRGPAAPHPPRESASAPAPATAPPARGEPPLSGPVDSPPQAKLGFPVTVSSGPASVTIRGPGIDEPLTCSGTCTFVLSGGTHWFDVQGSGRNWTTPVTITEPQHVVIEKPNAGARGLGVAAIIVGGLTFSIAGLVSYATLVNCSPGAPNEGTEQCDTNEEALPYWLAATGVGAVVSVIGIAVFIGNKEPSVEILPAVGNRAWREPSTFIGLGSTPGSTLPGLTLGSAF